MTKLYIDVIGIPAFMHIIWEIRRYFVVMDWREAHYKREMLEEFNKTKIGSLRRNPAVPDVRSLNYEMGGSDGDVFELQDTLVAPDSFEITLKELALREAFDKFFESKILTPKEKLVLHMRFGIDCSHAHNLEETGASLGISKERVRQIEEKAKAKAKAFFKQNHIDIQALLE